MADYTNLAELRRALSSDDADERSDAWGDVYEHDVRPRDVLETPPDEAVLSTLQENGVIPAPEGGPTGAAAEHRQEMLSLLREIRDNTGGSA